MTHLSAVGMTESQRPWKFSGELPGRSKARLSGLYALVDQAVVSGTNFFTFVFVGRCCGAAGLGIYSLTLSLSVLSLVALQSLVMVPYVNLLRGRKGTSHTRFSGNALRLVASLSAGLAVIVLVVGLGFQAGGKRDVSTAFYLLATAVPFTMLREFARRYLFANLRFRQAMLLDIVVATLQVGAICALAALGVLSSANVWLAIGAACAVASTAWLLIMRRKFSISRRRFKLSALRHWHFGKWVFASEATVSLRSQMVNWFLLLAGGALATGLFAASASITRLLNPFFMAAANFMEPAMARWYASGGVGELRRLVQRFTLTLCGTMLPLCIIVHLFGSPIMTLIFGREYAVSADALSLLVAAMFVSVTSVPATFALRALHRPDLTFKIRLSGFFTCLVLAAVLIPFWQVVGAAFAMLAGSAVSATVRWTVFGRVIGNQPAATAYPQPTTIS